MAPERLTCLQIQANVIAIIETVVSGLFILLFSLMGVTLAVKKEVILEAIEKYPEEGNDYPHIKRLMEAPVAEQISLFVIPICYFVTELGLAILLFHSVRTANHKRLRLWFIVTGTLVVVGLVFLLAEVLRHEDFDDVIVINVVNLLFTLYSMWVVYSLIGEIKAGGVRHPVPYNNGFYKL